MEHGIAILATGATAYQTRRISLRRTCRRCHPPGDGSAMFRRNDDPQNRTWRQRCRFHPVCRFAEMKNTPIARRYVAPIRFSKRSGAEKTQTPKRTFTSFTGTSEPTGSEKTFIKAARRNRGVLFFPLYVRMNKPIVGCRKQRRRERSRSRMPFIGRTVSCRCGYSLPGYGDCAANDNHDLTQQFKVPVDGDGWMLEAHQKLRPVEFATEGVFLCGMSHYPKPVEESIAQAQCGCRQGD